MNNVNLQYKQSFKGSPNTIGLAFFLRFVVFWILFFIIQRLLFLIHYWPKFKEVSFDDIVKSFYYGLRVDLAMIGLFTLAVIPFFLTWMALRNKREKLTIWILKTPVLLILLTSIFVHSGEIAVYQEWGHKLSTRVFTHLFNPDEMYRSAKFADVAWFVFYSLLQFAVGFILLKISFKPLMKHMNKLQFKPLFYPLHLLIFVPICILMSRGGWQQIPITISAAMFSQSPIVNDLCINSTYYFLQSSAQDNQKALDQLFENIDPQEARTYFDAQLKNCNDYTLFLDTIRPNLVFVVLESWASDAISYSGKIENTTPHFDALIDEGLYFSNCYATSGTSEVGLTSIFSGFPGLVSLSLPLSQEKSRSVKSINQTLKTYGYTSSYLFGGDLKYGNLGAYFLDHQFDEVRGEDSFKNIKNRGALAIYDTDLLQEFIQQINQKKEPFMSVAFTGSTHSPWDIPKAWEGFYQGNEAGIINTIRFADHALGAFIAEAKKQKWFDNTLFIFVADHGRTTPFNEHHFTPDFFRIPLLFWGKPIQQEFKGMKIDQIISQADLVATLLAQMNIENTDFPYSRNQMCPSDFPFAIYSSTLGYGGVGEDCNFFYNMTNDSYFTNSCEDSNSSGLIQKVQWTLKTVWEEFKAL